MRIVYIDIDSLRPDHLGCYGYARACSPNIDHIAKQGVRFDNCYASNVPCMPSRTSLFCGQFWIHHGCVSHTGSRAEIFSEGAGRRFRFEWGRTTWMRQLRSADMRTVTFSSFADHHVARVPLIVRWPGIIDSGSSQCDSGLHYHIDLAATVCELLNIETPAAWDAQSMADVLRGKAAQVDGRETRRIVGEYERNSDDYVARRQFSDQIGVFNKFVDIHVRDASDGEYECFQNEKNNSGRLGSGECFGLPYGIIVPKGWRNLWVAGRCNSSDIRVHGSIRVMPADAMMGQAAGTAAVQAIKAACPAFSIDTRELIGTLRRYGAYLPQEENPETSVPGNHRISTSDDT